MAEKKVINQEELNKYALKWRDDLVVTNRDKMTMACLDMARYLEVPDIKVMHLSSPLACEIAYVIAQVKEDIKEKYTFKEIEDMAAEGVTRLLKNPAPYGQAILDIFGTTKDKVDLIKKYSDRVNGTSSTYWNSSACIHSYAKEKLGVAFDEEKYNLFVNYAKNTTYVVATDVIWFSCDAPKFIHWGENENGRAILHKDGDQAISFSDGWGWYSLNGVDVPKYLAVTPKEDLDVEFFLKEENADIKAEFLAKYGIDRLVDRGEVVDSFENYDDLWFRASEYQLVDLHCLFESLEYAPYLKMKNQTTGAIHVEGVSPECRTIKDAMEFRTGVDFNNVTIGSIQ